MVEHKLVSFATILASWTVVTFLIKVIRILLKWKCTQDKNNAILADVAKREAILSKAFRPGHSSWSAHIGNFHPGHRDLGFCDRDLGCITAKCNNNAKCNTNRKCNNF